MKRQVWTGALAAFGAALALIGCQPNPTVIRDNAGVSALPVPSTTTTTLPPEPPPPPPPPPETVVKPPRFTQAPTVRIWISSASGTPEITAGACRAAASTGQVRMLPRLGPARAANVFTGVRIGEEFFKCAWLELTPEGEGQIKVDNRSFSGTVRLIRSGEKLTVVSVLDMERYLLGVLGGEMPTDWPREALRAQAVAARTYALYYHVQRAGFDWDVQSTVEDQVYSGGRPKPSVADAVAGTAGQVMLHDGGLFPAFFHSTCGGGTETPGRAIGKSAFNFLEGVPCQFCRASNNYEWREVISAADLAARLKAAGIAVGPVTGVTALDAQDETGRNVRISTLTGDTLVPIVDFRRAVGYMAVRSGKFECRAQNGILTFTGHGFGHGAGMCQYGCRGMAEQGNNYRRILSHYYRNTTVEKLY